jgi:hypothetical protein
MTREMCHNVLNHTAETPLVLVTSAEIAFDARQAFGRLSLSRYIFWHKLQEK